MKNLKTILFVSAVALSACATNIANFSPIEIASNSVRRTDALSGVTEVISPRFTVVKGRRSHVRGQAQLRTAGPFNDDKGHVHKGGAYLDVTLNYASATPHPAEARQYDQASWPGGQVALVADYGASVLDCREDIRQVRQYTPIYGAWGYGHIHDDYCDHRHGGYGYYGYGHVHDDNCGHNVDADDDDTVEVRPTTDPRPDPRRVSGREGRTQPNRIRPQTQSSPIDGIDERDLRGDLSRRPTTGLRSTPELSPRPTRTVTPNREMRDNPGRQVRQDIRPQQQLRTAPTPRATSRPISRPKPVKSGTIKSSRTPIQLNYYPRDRYYDYGARDYVVRRSCDRQENIRIFVPRARLDAAEQNGLLVYLRPRGGHEEVVSLPPNYISGFKLAAWSPEGQNMTLPETTSSPRDDLQASRPSTPLPSKKSVTDRTKPIIYGGN